MNIIESILKQDTEHKTLLNVPIKGIMQHKKEWIPKNKSKRLNQETGIYNIKPIDTDDFKTYYHEKARKHVICKQCHELVLNSSMGTHVVSQKCLTKYKINNPSDEEGTLIREAPKICCASCKEMVFLKYSKKHLLSNKCINKTKLINNID